MHNIEKWYNRFVPASMQFQDLIKFINSKFIQFVKQLRFGFFPSFDYLNVCSVSTFPKQNLVLDAGFRKNFDTQKTWSQPV